MTKLIKIIVSLAALAVASVGVAAPISYQGDLTSTGLVESKVEKEAWWTFSANAGDILTITVRRLEAALDPALVLYSGVSSNINDLTFLGYRDDNLDAGVAGGPFGDPQFSNFGITETGEYSLRLFSFVSLDAGQDGLFDYSINVENSTALTSASVSEPATFGIMALSMMGLMGLRRKLA